MGKKRPQAGGTRGFSLVELMIVVSIVGLLIALLLPALGAAQEYRDLLVCQSNLHAIAQAALHYAADYKGAIVPARYGTSTSGPHWCNLLVTGGYLSAPDASGLDASTPTALGTIFRCPAGVDAQWTSSTTFAKPDDNAAQGWYRAGDDENMVDCWYYWNGSTGLGGQNADRCPSREVSSTGTDQAEKFHYMSEIRHHADFAMVMDGVYLDGVAQPQRIAARHTGDNGPRSRTNIAFYDAHVEAIERDPGRNWADDVIMSRTPNLEGRAKPVFLLTEMPGP